MKKPKSTIDKLQMVLTYAPTTPDMAGYGCNRCGKPLGVRHGVMFEGISEDGLAVMSMLCLKCADTAARGISEGRSGWFARGLAYVATGLNIAASWAMFTLAGFALIMANWEWMALGIIIGGVGEVVLGPLAVRLALRVRE